VSPATQQPCLEHQPDVGADAVRVPIDSLPFRIGRAREAQLVLGSPRISKLHAEIAARGSRFVIRDLDSRNGTFVNGEAIEGERALEPGDVIHIAHRELRFVLVSNDEGPVDDATLGGEGADNAEIFRATRDLYVILTRRRVSAVFQAIVTLGDGAVIGYEALGRHTLPHMTADATALFRLAHERGKADELSRLMRTVALDEIPHLPSRGERMFMNVHPDEMWRGDLLSELEQAAEKMPGRQLVAEIHEAAIADPAQMTVLKRELRARGIELAYDDFGAGRSRLMELAEVPPDFLKLDMGLIRAIDTSPGRQELVAALVKVMRDAGIRVIAEGIETAEEQKTCQDLGCELGQGFLIKRPASAENLRETWP
jgi:EAL domain-containing protein (putative c-di-GMP-specific phosphodiesterase class I)